MKTILRLAIATIAAIAFVHVSTGAIAQTIKQIKLSEKQVEGFIAAQKDMGAITEKLEGTAADKPDPKIQAQLEAIAKKNGFKDFAEYDDVAANISIIMSGIDPQTKAFTEPAAVIKKEISEVTADKAIPDAEKKALLAELQESLKTAAPIQHAGNIDLVTKNFDKIEAAMQ